VIVQCSTRTHQRAPLRECEAIGRRMLAVPLHINSSERQKENEQGRHEHECPIHVAVFAIRACLRSCCSTPNSCPFEPLHWLIDRRVTSRTLRDLLAIRLER